MQLDSVPQRLTILSLMRPLLYLLCLLLLGTSFGCAIAGTDKNLAPLYARYSTADGRDEIEAAGGSILIRRKGYRGPLESWALRPFLDHTVTGPRSFERWYLYPFGLQRTTPTESVGQLLPIFRYHERYDGNKTTESSLISIIGIYWAHFPDGSSVRSWFPFFGRLENTFTFDQLNFLLFPLFARSERAGQTNLHFLFPIFQFGYGKYGRDWRVWPVVGRKKLDGLHDRWFFLWPVFQYHRNNLKAPESAHETKWMIFPLFGRTHVGEFDSWTVLWPFFGYSRDKKSGFWAWDGPWPLIRVQRPGKSGNAERTRFWPFYSRYEANGTRQTQFLWPLGRVASDTYNEESEDEYKVHRSSFIPFWQSWRKKELDGTSSGLKRLWPLYAHSWERDVHRRSYPGLLLPWYFPEFNKRWSWIWDVYSRTNHAETLRERSWLGLYRREKDKDEDRQYLSVLWARRKYTLRGERVRETSLLFGLLRWRSSESAGFELLPPGLPGPGWPRERVPNSLLPPLETASTNR